MKLRRKHRGVAAKEAKQALGLGARDELVVRVEKGRVRVKARAKSYTKYMLGLHSNVWKGVKAEQYIWKERDAW